MKKSTRKWLRKADEDLDAAHGLFETKRGSHDTVCFHCQQAAEKYLKALICEAGLAPPKVHDLTQLASLLAPHAKQVLRHRRRLSTLTEFAVEYRYPNKRARAAQARSALRKADVVRQFCIAELEVS
jgi:HEPN domain-containing protein